MSEKSEKNEKCLAILKKYSLLVDFDGKAAMNTIKPAIEGETFGQWKKRLWGDSADHVVVYVPTQPGAKKRISNLQHEAGVDHLRAIFRQLAKEQRQEIEDVVADTTSEIKKIYSSVSKESLQDAVANLEDELEPSVSKHLDTYLAKQPDDVEIEPLFHELLRTCNIAAKLARQREKEIAELKQALERAQKQLHSQQLMSAPD